MIQTPPEVRTLCAVLHDTGRRESEALELTPERVDLEGGCLVFRTLKKRREGVYRAVPVPPAAPSTSSTSCTASGMPAGAEKGTSTGPCGRGPA